MDMMKIYKDLQAKYHKPKYDPDTGEVYTNQLDLSGREILDPTPIAPPIGYKRQPTMVEHIRAMVRNERLAQELAAQGVETFEESEDFDIGDDYDPASPWENEFDPSIAEITRSVEEARQTPPAPPNDGPNGRGMSQAPSEPAQPAPSQAPATGAPNSTST